MPIWLVKENIDIILPVLVSIVNTLLSSGEFPSALKDGIATPVLKNKAWTATILRPLGLSQKQHFYLNLLKNCFM